jgi:hypothetical protein
MIFFGSKEKPEDLIYQGMSRMKKNQPKAAIPLFNQALKQEPKKSRGLTQQGTCLE